MKTTCLPAQYLCTCTLHFRYERHFYLKHERSFYLKHERRFYLHCFYMREMLMNLKSFQCVVCAFSLTLITHHETTRHTHIHTHTHTHTHTLPESHRTL